MRRASRLFCSIVSASLTCGLALGSQAKAGDGWDVRVSASEPATVESFELRAGLQAYSSNETGLRGALETTVARNPSLHAALRDVTAADRDVWAALLKYTPVITGSVQSNAYSDPGSTSLNFNNRDSYVAITASLPIWTSGGRYYGVKAARSRREAIAYDAMAVRDQATMSLIESWTQAVAAMQDRDLAKRSIQRFQRLKSAVTARQKAGFASAFDISQIEADIAAARQALISIEGTIEKLGEKLQRNAGRKPARGAKFSRFGRYLDRGEDAFIESAHRNNPQLRAASSQYRSEVYSTRSSMSRFLPSVNLSGEYRHYLSRASGSSGNEGWSVGVQLKVPLLDLSSVAMSAAQDARADAALYREAATLNDVEEQISGLWSDYKTTVKMRAETEREAAARRKSANSTLSRFEKGFGTLEEAISAETELLTAERTILQLSVRETITAAQLLLSAGMFKPEMLSEQ